ncbi:MAG: CAP domain-containing protein [Eubacteriales bacterium]|nr:CAP domain-containing protein [Eubacteriales bacterium]
MRKKRLFIIAASATLACSIFTTAYASEATVVSKGNGYVVVAGQGIESLEQTLEEIKNNLGDISLVCPEIPEIPEQPEILDNQEPETPEQPDIPDNQEPETPEQPEIPDNQEPETPEQPDIPEQPDAPDNGKPEQPDVPDEEEPDSGITEDSVHAYARQVVTLVNEERAKAGLPEVTLNLDITAAANVRAKEIKQNFAHTRPDGSSFSTALTEQGVSYRGSGENIAWGQKTPEEVMNGWMNSDGHRANILNKNFRNIGVGYYQDERGVNYWVQLFTY